MPDRSPIWGTRKTLKYVVPASVLAFLVVMAFLPHDSALKVSKAKGGECIVLPTSSVVNMLQKRDCDQPHTGEVYAAFRYPGVPAADQPAPEENCQRVPDGLTADQAAYYQRVLDVLAASGNQQILVTNNADTTQDREYACIIGIPEQKGQYLDVVAAQAQAADPAAGG